MPAPNKRNRLLPFAVFLTFAGISFWLFSGGRPTERQMDALFKERVADFEYLRRMMEVDTNVREVRLPNLIATDKTNGQLRKFDEIYFPDSRYREYRGAMGQLRSEDISRNELEMCIVVWEKKAERTSACWRKDPPPASFESFAAFEKNGYPKGGAYRRLNGDWWIKAE